jgi:hypothetical protein
MAFDNTNLIARQEFRIAPDLGHQAFDSMAACVDP